MVDRLKAAVRRARFQARRLTRHKPLDRETLRDYWTAPPDAGNQPTAYLSDEAGAERSRFLVDLFDRHACAGSVLELGCNAGRNLYYLWEAGWRDLAAIEVNESALSLLRATFPDMAATATLIAGTLEDRLPELADNSFDVVFSVAVLEHVHYDSDWLFPHIVRVARRHVVTVEHEEDVSDRTFPRDYRKVLEPLGTRQVAQVVSPPGLPPGFVARVFERIDC